MIYREDRISEFGIIELALNCGTFFFLAAIAAMDSVS
jgi:hypothetical protein